MDFKNFAYSTIATAPSPATTGTSMVLASGDGAKFPTTFPYNIVVWATGSNPTSANSEIVRVTAITTDTLTIVRQQEGTSARTIVVGDQVMLALTGEQMRRIEGHLSILQSDWSVSSVATAQNVFNTSQDVITLEASTLYEVEGWYSLTTGTTAHTLGISFLAGGSLTINWMNLHARGFNVVANGTATATNGSYIDRLANTVVTASATTAGNMVWFKGHMSINAGGTITPQFQFSAGPTGTNLVKAGSWLKFKKLGINSTAIIGDFA
jgi:hypothetical protein